MSGVMTKEEESVTIQPIRRMDAFGFVPDIILELPAPEKKVSAAIDKEAGKLSRAIDPNPVLMYLVLESNPTLRGLMESVGKVDRPPEFQNLDLMSPKDRAQNAAFALGTIRAAVNSTANTDFKKELEAVDKEITAGTGAVVSGTNIETHKKGSGFMNRALRKLPIKVLGLTTIAAFLAGCAGTAVASKTHEPGGTSTQTSEVSLTPTGVATTPAPSETPTNTSTPPSTETSTATEVPFEQLVLQTNPENFANYTEITLDDIQSGRASYWEHQAYTKGELKQFGPDVNFTPIISSEYDNSDLGGGKFDEAVPNPDALKGTPELFTMIPETFYVMKTDKGDMWVMGMAVLNQDNSVSFMHLLFDPKVWNGSDVMKQQYLNVAKGTRMVSIYYRPTNCDKAPSTWIAFHPIYGSYDLSRTCPVYQSQDNHESIDNALDSWASSGQVSSDMEKDLFIAGWAFQP
jgi:hypothetical protein